MDRYHGDPEAIHINNLDQIERVKDILLPIAIDGVEPTVANVTNGSYPLSRALYIYAIKRRVEGTHIFDMIVRYNMDAAADVRGGYGWGLIPLPKDERKAVLAKVDALQEPSK
jgi:hypothetical protein